MAVPFSDFVLADVGLVQWGVLLTATTTVAAFLYALRPPVTQRMLIAFVPWIVSGSILHVFWQLQEALQRQLYPASIEGLFSAPAVYLTAFIPLGIVWAVSAVAVPSYNRSERIAVYVGTTGVGVMVLLTGLLLRQGRDEAVAPMEPIWPVVGLLISLALTFLVYIAIGSWRTYVLAEARFAGAFVLFGHIFDAVTTAVGVEQLGAGERSALPRAIIDFAADLPTADLLGSAWLFVVVKILLASAIVVAFADYVSEKPTQGNLMFAVIGAVGLGPATNNFFLFLLAI